MKEIEHGPSDYRRTNLETGRVEYPVDRKLCFWMAIGAMAFLAIMGWRFQAEMPFVAAAFFSLVGFCAGGLFTMSLRRLNW